MMERASLATEVVADLARRGARVALCLLDHAPQARAIASAERAEGHDVRALELGGTEREELASLAERATHELGSMDLLVVQPALPHAPALPHLADTEWSSAVLAPVSLPFRLFQVASAAMIEQGYGGRIVMVLPPPAPEGAGPSTAAGIVREAHRAIVGAFADDLGRYDITVNAIDPGCFADSHSVGALPAAEAHAIPKGRAAVPADVAPLVSFLASDDADYITGVVLPVDGGRRLRVRPGLGR